MMPVSMAVLLLLSAHYLGHLFDVETPKLSLVGAGMSEQGIAVAYLSHFPI